MILTLTIIFFILGAIIGSFLNVVIYRYNTKKTLGGRSFCMSCHNQLCWYDLVPILSFCALSGRCRKCKTKISVQYPLVEFFTGLIFAGLFLKFKFVFFESTFAFSSSFIYYAIMFSILMVIAVYDLKHKIIPDMLSLVFGILAFAGIFLFDSSGNITGLYLHAPSVWDFLSGLVISVPFAFLWLVSRGSWMGLGDAKLAVGLGLLLGMMKLLSAIVLAFWTGALVGIILIVFSKKHGMRSEIPFAPFLVASSILAFILELHFFTILF